MAAAEAAPSRGGLLGSSRDASDELGGGGNAGGGADDLPSFRFEARRARLDWRLLHSVDVDRMMRENDIDTLESALVRGAKNTSLADHQHDTTRANNDSSSRKRKEKRFLSLPCLYTHPRLFNDSLFFSFFPLSRCAEDIDPPPYLSQASLPHVHARASRPRQSHRVARRRHTPTRRNVRTDDVAFDGRARA